MDFLPYPQSNQTHIRKVIFFHSDPLLRPATMATGANATPLGKLHPSIGAKRGFDAGPGAGNGLMPNPGPTAAFPALQAFQPPAPNPSFAAHQFSQGANFPAQVQPPAVAVGGGLAKPGTGDRPLAQAEHMLPGPGKLRQLTVLSS